MATAPSIQAALIAGGRSSRMGEDKAFLDWMGRPLFAFQLEKLLASVPGGEVFLSTNRDQAFPDFMENVRLVPDSEADLGPLGALRDCLAAAEPTTDWMLVLGVDLPLVPVEFLQQLVIEATHSGRGIVPRINDRWDPLAAIFPRSILPLVQSRVAEGVLSMQRFCDQAESEGLIRAQDSIPSEWLSNLNRPEDYARLQQGLLDRPTLLHRYRDGKGFRKVDDRLAAEEPLEIRVEGKSVAVMMRTPGNDDELAAGFLVTENVVHRPESLFEISRCREVDDPESAGNVVDVRLAPDHEIDLESLTRHVFTSSSCGVCGKATIDSVFQDFPPLDSPFSIAPEALLSLPGKLREAQATFEKTGGLHASALFDASGEFHYLREDVGRHNALDKVIGRALLDGDLPLSDRLLLVSGRISFELIQKALAAGIPFIAGISAPSSLAVEFAQRSGQTLVGFLREGGFNLYAGAQRVTGS